MKYRNIVIYKKYSTMQTFPTKEAMLLSISKLKFVPQILIFYIAVENDKLKHKFSYIKYHHMLIKNLKYVIISSV